MIFRDEMRAYACDEKDFGNGIKSPKSRSYFVDVVRGGAAQSCVSDMAGGSMSGLFGTPTQVAVERGLAEFRSGRPVILTLGGGRTLALPVDGMTDQGLIAFSQLCAPARPRLLIAARGARPLGTSAGGPRGLAIGDLYTRAPLFSLAADAQAPRLRGSTPPGEPPPAAIELAKLAQLLPALLFCEAG